MIPYDLVYQQKVPENSSNSCCYDFITADTAPMTNFIKLPVSAFIAILFCAASAWATPPRYASVNDTVVGISPTQVFMLRTISDNHGSHYINSVHRFLVAQDIRTGDATQHWLLDVVRQEYNFDTESTKIVFHDVQGSANPMEILAENGAFPASASSQIAWGDNRYVLLNPYRLTGDGLIKTDEDAPRILASTDEIKTYIAATLNPVLKSMNSDTGPVDPITFDENAYSLDLADCFVQSSTGGVVGFSAFWLDCENGDFDVFGYKVFLLIRDAS